MEDEPDATEAIIQDMSDGAGGIEAQHGELTVENSPIIHLGTLGDDPTTLVTTDDGTGSLGQQIVIVSEDGSFHTTEDGEPATKRIRVEQNGQTYVLQVTENSNLAHLIQETPIVTTSDEVSASMAGAEVQVEPEVAAVAEEGENTDVTQAWFTSRDDKNALHNKGQTWKTGQWSKDEVELLQTNISNFCKEHKINDPCEIIFEMSKDERKDFYRNVARGLMRPLFSVYRRVIRMYDQKNHVGKYTPEEIQLLKDLRNKHGTDWASIGAALGRSASSVKDKCRLMKDTCNAGKWLPEEEKRLAAAVYELAGVHAGENVTAGLSWSAVAEKVSTRSEKQCRTKWLNYLNWKQKGGTEWTREDDLQLVLKIGQSGASDENNLDWTELAKGWPSVRSPQWLRGKWWSLKRHVPDYQMLSCQEIVEYIRNIHSQNLRVTKTVQPSGAIRVNRLELPRVKVIQNKLYVPISAVQGTSTLTAPITSSSEEADHTSFQAFEVLQSYTPTSSQGAFLITQPQANPAISFAAHNMSTDHIIVHTLPIASTGGIQEGDGVENVTVQLNHQPEIIMQTSEGGQDQVAIETHQINAASLSHLTDAGIAHTHQGLTALAQSDQMVAEAESEISQSELDCQAAQISAQGQILHDEVTYEAQTITASDIAGDVSQSALDGSTVGSADLVMVTAASPQFVQSSSNDGELISFSDPMLTTDLICSTSDMEGEKTQSNGSTDGNDS